MSCISVRRRGRRCIRSLKTRCTSLAALFLIGSTILPGGMPAADDFSPQIIQVLDLAVIPPGLQVLGAADSAHLGGNGSPATSGSFPRSRAVAAGDLNDDGIDDFIIGAPDVTFTPQGGSARDNSGAVYIVFGEATIASPIDTNPSAPAQPDIRIFGATAGDNLGFAVGVGDINGDAIDDLIAGAPGFDFPGSGMTPTPRPESGAVFILFGAEGLATGSIDLATANAADDLIAGAASGDLLGASLALSDVDGGDSDLDLLIGAPGSKGPDPVGAARNNGGAAYLLTGGELLANPAATTKVIDLAADAAVVRIFGKTDSQLGSAVAAGDVNGDGIGDPVIAAPKADRPDAVPVDETGAVFALFGGAALDPTPPATSITIDINADQQKLSIYGASASDHLGAAVAIGDVDNDGALDIAAGAPDAAGPEDLRPLAGEAYVIKGGQVLNPAPPATSKRIDISLDTAALTVFGAAAGDHLGACVAAGVVNSLSNRDTVEDLLIGAPGAVSTRGTVNVLFGGSGLTQFPGRDVLLGQDDLRLIGIAAGDELGWAIATGDFDDNTGGDIAVAAPFADVTDPAPTRTDAGKAFLVLASASNIPPQNQNPTVEVLDPDGGETLLGGGAFEIEWSAADADGDGTIQRFDISLSLNSGATFNTTIASNLAGDARTFSWDVPTGLNSTTARVRVTATDSDGGTGEDASAADFSISDPGILVTLTAPDGGESLKWDQNFNIQWELDDGLEDQVRGFDLFFTTNNGVTFTNITAPNPTQPALAADVRQFQWMVPRICASAVRVVVRATSVTSAVSSVSSNAFSISEQEPHIDTTSIAFANKKQITFHLQDGTTPPFVSGTTIEISSDQAGTQFHPVTSVKVKANGTKLLAKGKANGEKLGDFWPSGANRFVRITSSTCRVNLLLLQRQGDILVPMAVSQASASLKGKGTPRRRPAF